MLADLKKTMSSLEIAQITGKPHNDLLKSIRKMEVAWSKITGGNFSLSEYKDSTGRKQPMYELTKRECLYIGTKFNDEERAKLVLRWEELETQKQLSPAEQLLYNAQLLVAQEKRMNAIESDVQEIKAQLTTRPQTFTIAGYATLNGIKMPLKLASNLGRKASRLCKIENIIPDEIPDPRFGIVKSYPIEILEEVFNDILVN
ncbi:MAG: Rha family transcriptional regulator [Tenacibaculum sp.]|nr:Rha family transcriptional regulator [Tenacibaculum sp.]